MSDHRPNNRWLLGDWLVQGNSLTHQATGDTQTLEPRAGDVLRALAARPGRFVSREELFAEVWRDRIVTDDSLTGAVRSIRKALADDSRRPQFIETRKGVGYRLLQRPQPVSWWKPRRLGLAAALLLLASMALFGILSAPSSEPTPRTLAVLPFTALGNGPAPELAPVITDELIMRLGDQTGLRLYSRRSTLMLDSAADLTDAAAALPHAEGLITGTVASDAEHLRVNVRLIDPVDQTQRWARQFERPVREVSLLQNDLVDAIAAEVGAAVQVEMQPLAMPEATARDLMRARFLATRDTVAQRQQALELFRGVTARHPESALAWQGQAETLLALYKQRAVVHADLDEALAAARRAQRIAGSSARVHRLLGQLHLFARFDYREAEAHYRRALALNPGDTVAMQRYAWLLVAMQRFEEAAEQWARTQQLDPSTYASAETPYVRLFAGDYATAAREFERLADDGFGPALLRGQFIAYQLSGDPRAASVLRRLVAAQTELEPAALAAKDVSELLLALLDAEAYQSAVAGASYAALRGDDALALELLKRAVRERDPFTIYLQSMPEFRSLHDDPEFGVLLAQIHQPRFGTPVAANDSRLE